MDNNLTTLNIDDVLKKAGEKIENFYIPILNLQKQTSDIEIFNCVIGEIILTDCQIQHKIHLENVVVEGSFIAGKKRSSDKAVAAQFDNAMILKNCKFKGEVVFGHCVFSTLMSCQDCVFFEEVIFGHAHFKEQAYFWGSQFNNTISFNHAVFEVEGHFDKCDFRAAAHFVKVNFKGQDASFNYITAQTDIDFSEIDVDCFFAFRESKIDGKIDFKKAVFHKDADFIRSAFRSNVTFENAHFHEKTDFSYAQFAQSSFFYGSSFSNITFLNAQFNNEVLFNLDSHTRRSLGESVSEIKPAQFNGNSDFTNTRFHKRAIFENVTFVNEAHFANCFFGEQANFINVRANDYICFDSVYCNQEFSAVGGKFAKITFDYANINRRLDLSGATLNALSFYKAAVDLMVVEAKQIRRKLIHENPEKPSYEKCAEEYLLLKESFYQRGLHEEEDWAYFKFRQTKRKYRTKENIEKMKAASFINKLFYLGKLPFSLFERILIDRATGYGTRPLNITIVAISFILFFGAVYSYFPDTLVKPESMPFGFAQATYFSFATFTTMGFGDIQPRLDSIMPYVVSTEAFFGLFIMTLFVGTYTRKIIR
ncbi:potassium channel family protein [Candidatus Uabimicrobium sp. HlEnr_7]|uniref:potassium channel family protein n=1 Tax=Candidatus Uabimicrobium helgolandensis TaxID=3095367 RepID=UPI003558E793